MSNFNICRSPLLAADADTGNSGDNNNGTNESNNTNSTVNTQKPNVPDVQGKVFSDEYVKSLREESKDHRLKSKGYESKIKSLLGLKPEDDISDLDNLITNFKNNNQKSIDVATQKSKNMLLKAEIKALDGYNHKLVEKLLDTSNVTIDNDGTVTGLKEALESMEKDFPEVKALNSNTSNSGFRPAGNSTEVFSKEQVSKMSVEEVKKNYAKIIESKKTW